MSETVPDGTVSSRVVSPHSPQRWRQKQFCTCHCDRLILMVGSVCRCDEKTRQTMTDSADYFRTRQPVRERNEKFDYATDSGSIVHLSPMTQHRVSFSRNSKLNGQIHRRIGRRFSIEETESFRGRGKVHTACAHAAFLC